MVGADFAKNNFPSNLSREEVEAAIMFPDVAQ